MSIKRRRGIYILEEIFKYADTPYVRHRPNGETYYYIGKAFSPDGKTDCWMSDTIQEIGDPNWTGEDS